MINNRYLILSCAPLPAPNTTHTLCVLYQELYFNKFNKIYSIYEAEKNIDQLKEAILEATHIHLVVPEYNGSFPGYLKYMIDLLPMDIWKDKKICLTGISGGFSGNIIGVDQLYSIFTYLKSHVFYFKMNINNIRDKINISFSDVNDPEINMTDKEILERMEQQVESFISY